MTDQERYLTHSLRGLPQGRLIAEIMDSALSAVDPATAVNRYVRREGNTLFVGEKPYHLNLLRRVFVVGAGKASLTMAAALEPLLEDYLEAGIIISKAGFDQYKALDVSDGRPSKIQRLSGSHPIPDESGISSTKQLIGLLTNLDETDLVIGLISGGGSALLTQPCEGIRLSDIQLVTKRLLACGANINEINTIRKHLDQIKGGGLARMIYPAQSAVLILSDVVGNPLDVIASGPTTADESTFEEAEVLLKHYGIWYEIPEFVRMVVDSGKKGELAETLKEGDYRLERVQNLVIASNQLACEAACDQAQKEGLNAMILTTYLQGEARCVGGFLGSILTQIADTGQPLQRPACMVTGGETTVVVHGKGHGGRNQEVALGAIRTLTGLIRSCW